MAKSSTNGFVKIWSSFINWLTHFYHLELNAFNSLDLSLYEQIAWLIEWIPINFKCFKPHGYEQAAIK